VKLISYFNNRVRMLTIFDIKLIQWAAIFVALITAKIFPRIMDISILWFVALFVMSLIRPMYVFIIKKE